MRRRVERRRVLRWRAGQPWRQLCVVPAAPLPLTTASAPPTPSLSAVAFFGGGAREGSQIGAAFGQLTAHLRTLVSHRWAYGAGEWAAAARQFRARASAQQAAWVCADACQAALAWNTNRAARCTHTAVAARTPACSHLLLPPTCCTPPHPSSRRLLCQAAATQRDLAAHAALCDGPQGCGVAPGSRGPGATAGRLRRRAGGTCTRRQAGCLALHPFPGPPPHPSSWCLPPPLAAPVAGRALPFIPHLVQP